jgi:hypothetical protein
MIRRRLESCVSLALARFFSCRFGLSLPKGLFSLEVEVSDARGVIRKREGGGKAAAPPEQRQTRDGCCSVELKAVLSLAGPVWLHVCSCLYGCMAVGFADYRFIKRMRMICVRCDGMIFVVVVIVSPFSTYLGASNFHERAGVQHR